MTLRELLQSIIDDKTNRLLDRDVASHRIDLDSFMIRDFSPDSLDSIRYTSRIGIEVRVWDNPCDIRRE